MIRCVYPKPYCGVCAYCKAAKDGPLWWLKR